MTTQRINKDGAIVPISKVEIQKALDEGFAETSSVLADAATRALHTAWQAGGATFVIGIEAVDSFSALETLALASGVAALAAAGAFLKTYAKAFITARLSKGTE